MRPVISIYRTFKSFKSRSSYNKNIINNYITIAINSLRSTRSYIYNHTRSGRRLPASSAEVRKLRHFTNR